MHPRTTATLEQLEQVDWFSKVGVNDLQQGMLLASWEDAIQHCSSIEWENLCLEAANQFRERLAERSVERFRKWNEVVDMLKPTTIPFVKRKVGQIVRKNNLPQVFENTVQWDILHLCMEAEYADVYPPGFYASQGYWYARGHFPCGWNGDFPSDTIIVY